MFKNILKTYKEAFSGLSHENWLLSTVMLINRMGTMAAVFMSIYVTQVLHKSLSEAGLVITLLGVGAVFGSLLGGELMKHIGFRKTQISTSITTGILFLIFSQTGNFQLICVLAVLIGIVSEAFRPANFTAISYYSKPEMITKSYSLNRFAVNLGMGLGMGIGGIIASIDYHLLFIVEGITSIAVGILIWTLLPSAKNIVEKAKTVKVEKDEKPMSPWKDWRYMKFMLILLFYISSFLIVFRFAPVFWKQEKHLDESTIGLIIGLNGMIIAIFEMVLVQRIQNNNRDIYYVFYGILCAAIAYAFLLLPVFPILAAVIGILFLTISEMLALPFVNTFVVTRSVPENRGSYAAVYTMVWSLSGVLAPMEGAYLAEHFGYNTLWIVAIGVCLLCSLAIRMIYMKPKKKSS